MATQEFYIRNETDTEARGPFTLEQLSSLAETGQVNPATLYYETATEEWLTVSANPPLKAAIFPDKKKLTLKTHQDITNLNEKSDQHERIEVSDLLAAAEGRTDDTKARRDPTESMARAAAMGRWFSILILLVCASGELLPSVDTILAMDWPKLVQTPVVFLGGLDVILAVLLALGMVSLYPFVRFRAALGFGFVGFLFWTQGQIVPLAALGIGASGLFLSTVFITYGSILFAALLGLGGMGFVTWLLLS
jgi:hypothetical protein